jgi:hypothetical protein
MSPYSCCLKLERNRSAVPQMKLEISEWFIVHAFCNPHPAMLNRLNHKYIPPQT